MRKLLYAAGALSVVAIAALCVPATALSYHPADYEWVEVDSVAVAEDDTVWVVEEAEAIDFPDSIWGGDTVCVEDTMSDPELSYGPIGMTEWKELFDNLKVANPELKMTPSGLIYLITDPGNSRKPLATSTIVANYEGSHPNGETFDSYFYDGTGTPLEFPLNRVIPAWTEAAQMIGEGGVITIIAPYWLAYGESGAGGVIEPYEPLMFNIELLQVK